VDQFPGSGQAGMLRELGVSEMPRR